MEHLKKSSVDATPSSLKASDLLSTENCSIFQLEQLVLEFAGGVPCFLVRAVVVLVQSVFKETYFFYTEFSGSTQSVQFSVSCSIRYHVVLSSCFVIFIALHSISCNGTSACIS